MKRVVAIAAFVDLVFLALALYTPIKNFLFVHEWLLSALAAAPALGIAGLELMHSSEANQLRSQANQLGIEANEYREDANSQRKEANAQRERANEALGRIADHTKKALTKAEKHAERLQKYVGAKAQVVNADDSRWGSPAEIVEIKNDVVTLFTPAGFSSSSASVAYVHSEDLEIIEATTGSVPLTLKVLKRYGTSENLGQIKSWDERMKSQAAPDFPKGGNVFNVEYIKPGSPERRRLDVFESADGQNYYMLLANSKEPLFGDNVAISRHFMLIQLEYEAQGFRYNGGGSGGSKHPLFMKTKA